MNGLEFIKDVSGKKHRKVLTSYITRDISDNMACEPFEIVSSLEPLSKENQLNITTLSEVIIKIDNLTKNQILKAFKKIFDFYESQAKEDEKKGRLNGSNVKIFGDLKGLLDKNLRFYDGYLYFMANKNDKYGLNILLKKLMENYQVRAKVFPMSNVYNTTIGKGRSTKRSRA